jgi:hypothetical protein
MHVSSHWLELSSTSWGRHMSRWHWRHCFMRSRREQSIREDRGGATWSRYPGVSQRMTMHSVLQSMIHVVPFSKTFVHTHIHWGEAFPATLMRLSSSHCFIEPLRTVHSTWLCEKPSTSRLVTISLLARTVDAWPTAGDEPLRTYSSNALTQC